MWHASIFKDVLPFGDVSLKDSWTQQGQIRSCASYENGAPFLTELLRSPMDLKCHSFYSLPRLGLLSHFVLASLFLTLPPSQQIPRKAHNPTDTHLVITLSGSYVECCYFFSKFRVCVCVYEVCMKVNKCMHVEVRNNASHRLPCGGRVSLISAAVLHIHAS